MPHFHSLVVAVAYKGISSPEPPKRGPEAAQVALGHARADVTQLYAEKNLALAATVAAEMG